MSFASGQQIGAYEIVGPLGAGGMGEVYRARDTRLGRLVAIKFVTDDLGADRTSAERLAHEARLTSSLNHPNIVTVHDVGEIDGRPFIVMEFIAGQSLHAALATGRMKPARVVEIACQIADGLAAAHGAGVVHRDLKPRNIMIAEDGRVKIVDFGLGKVPSPATGSEDPTMRARGLTAAHTIVGTAGYMAPEQVSVRPIDFRADQFALGAILYEMITGQRAFKRETPVQTMAAILETEPPPILDVAPEAPIEIVTILERCLAKDPADRYASTQDLARDLHDARRTLAGSRSVSAVRRAPPRRRHRWLLAAIVTLAVGAPAVYFTRDRSNPAAEARTLLDRYDKVENVDRAIALLEPAVATRPGDAVRQTLLAEAYWRKFEFNRDKALIDRAADAASAALKVDAAYAPTHVVLAMLNNGQSRYEGAAGEAQLGIDLDPNLSAAWRELGRARLGLRKPAEAGEAFRRATEIGPRDWTAFNNLGGYYFGTGRLEEAAKAFDRVLALAPDNTKAYNNLGSVFLRLERFDRAAEMYERSLSLDKNPVAYSNLGRAYYEQGLYAEAARSFEGAVALPRPTYRLWANLGAACYFVPELRERSRVAYETAIKLGQEARDVTPKDVSLLTTLADAHAVLALLSDKAGAATHTGFARSLLAAVETLKPHNPDDLFTVANTHEELGDRAQALSWLALAVKAGYPMKSVERSPWLKELRRDPAYISQFSQR